MIMYCCWSEKLQNAEKRGRLEGEFGPNPYNTTTAALRQQSKSFLCVSACVEVIHV